MLCAFVMWKAVPREELAGIRWQAALIETAASAEIYLVQESCKSEAGDSGWTALVLSRNRSSRRRTALTSESDCHISRKKLAVDMWPKSYFVGYVPCSLLGVIFSWFCLTSKT